MKKEKVPEVCGRCNYCKIYDVQEKQDRCVDVRRRCYNVKSERYYSFVGYTQNKCDLWVDKIVL